MLLSTNNLEELIIETLHKESQEGPSLLASLREKTSKETFYRVLRKLLRNEIITKQGSVYELNRHWLQKVYRFAKGGIGTESDHILSFREGEQISYSFKNPNLMGIYWAHIYDAVFEAHDPSVPILVFHPHEWLIYSRIESETFFLNRFQEDEKLVLFSLGGTTSLDKKFKKDWSAPFRQIATGLNHGLRNNEYLNVLGDFIFKVTITKRLGDDLEMFFKSHPVITPEAQAELTKLCGRTDRARMVFKRSKKEADMWRKRFSKHFFLSEQYRKG